MRGNDSRPTFESLGGITVFLAPWPYSNTSMNSLYMSPITVSETIATKKEIARAQIRHLRCRQNFAIRRAYYVGMQSTTGRNYLSLQCSHTRELPPTSSTPSFSSIQSHSMHAPKFQFRVSGWNCGSVSLGDGSDNDQLYPTQSRPRCAFQGF